MEIQYLSYAVTEAFLILFSIGLFGRLNINLGSEYEIRKLRSIILTYWGMLVTDIFFGRWWRGDTSLLLVY